MPVRGMISSCGLLSPGRRDLLGRGRGGGPAGVLLDGGHDVLLRDPPAQPGSLDLGKVNAVLLGQTADQGRVMPRSSLRFMHSRMADHLVDRRGFRDLHARRGGGRRLLRRAGLLDDGDLLLDGNDGPLRRKDLRERPAHRRRDLHVHLVGAHLDQ